MSKITRQSPAIQLLVHILGEMMVQKARMGAAEQQQGVLQPGGGQPQPQQPPKSEPMTIGQGNTNNPMQNAMPNRMQGGGDVAQMF